MGTRTHSRAGRVLVLCLVGLLLSLFLIAIIQGTRRQATQGVGPALPGPIRGAGVPTLCVNVALDETPEQDLAQTLDRIADAGFVWIRQTVPWAEIETEPGVYDWARWDKLVQAIADHPADLRLIAVFDTTPPWAIGNSVGNWDAAPPANPADLARFASAFVERYGDRIDVYQIWDEPNLSSHWGGRDVNPVEYAALLQATADAIRAAGADGQTTILLAGLAPTVETGPRNLSDVRYLRALYEHGAAASFDIVAGKPYGFDTGPEDRRLAEEVLNFSRLGLLRETMRANGDGDKAVWASHWGWNALPAGWAGGASLWGQTDAATQADRTVDALERARREWPWAGALCLEHWQPDAALDDPRWGFALIDREGNSRQVYDAIKAWAATDASRTNHPGYYEIGGAELDGPGDFNDDAGVADFVGDWRFSELGADVTEAGGQSVAIPFEGTDFGLRVRRGGYRAYFYVTIDGQPANALPQDEHGAYLVLASPDGEPEIITAPIAQGLPEGEHLARIEVERGWGQWPLVGWSVGWWPHADDDRSRLPLVALWGVALICAVGVVWSARNVSWRWVVAVLSRAWVALSGAAHIALAAAVTLAFWASASLTWGQEQAAGAGGIIATITSATIFYVSPVFVLSLVSLALLALLVILRLDLGLALVAFAAPFYLQSRAMFDRAFSVVEIAVFLCFISWFINHLLTIRSNDTGKTILHSRGYGIRNTRLATALSLDYAVLFFVAVAIVSLFVADIRGVALREFRVVVLGPALYYLMLRTTLLERSARWRIVDAFVFGAVVVALIGLYQYAFTDQVITAEGGLRRLKSVYGSPNNVGLYLGRALPVLVAVALFARRAPRRWLYGASAVAVGAAILLSFSKGALLFGIPASLIGLGLLAGGRWLWAAVSVLVVAAIAALPILRTPRFTSVFDLQSGTSFFRLNLWRSAVDMIRDHPLFGVGLDNFLYAYRGRYIRPQAWQEPDLSHPHNIVLDFWSRLGIFGLAAGAWLQVAFWRLALPLRRLSDIDERALALGLMASMVDFLAHGLVDNSFFLVDLAFPFFLTLALVVHLARTGNQ